MSIADNEVLIAGRGRAIAKAAIAAVEAAGFDGSVVRTVAAGYIIPLAAIDFYEPVGAPEEHADNSGEKTVVDADADADGEKQGESDSASENAGDGDAEAEDADKDKGESEDKPEAETKPAAAPAAAAKKPAAKAASAAKAK